MKKFIFIIGVVALILTGAFVMGYGADWSFDGFGIALIVTGAGLGTWQAFKLKSRRVRFILSLSFLWLSSLLFILAGIFNYSFTLIIAFLALAFLASYVFLFLKKF